ncbi:hypothetical protein M0805_007230 [Coniferiporia weirii]|nr:hypothetical protein M0805_007230 [Coniferiporia weirii]
MHIPIIRIIKPTEPVSPRLSNAVAGGIRRWRGALGTIGDLTLQLPNQGLTRGARLALARQGCATGSFKLNCPESPHAVDTHGRAMFEKIDIEEELETASYGLRERPPKGNPLDSDVDSGAEKGDGQNLHAAGFKQSRATRRMANGISKPSRQISLRTHRRNLLASQSMRFDSSGLSSCATFTEGLCNLEDYVQSGEAGFDNQKQSLGLFASHSMQEIKGYFSKSSWTTSSKNLSLPWFDSLRRKTRPDVTTSDSKRRVSTRALNRPLSCCELDSFLSDSEYTILVESPSSNSSMGKRQVKKSGRRKMQVQSDKPLGSGSSRQLPRDNSWSRFCHRLSRGSSTKDLDRKLERNKGPNMQDSSSIASGPFFFPQQGVPVSSTLSST